VAVKTFRTSSLVAPVVDPGTYWSYFGYDNLWCEEAAEIRENGGFVCDDYSYETFGKMMCMEATKAFAHERVLRDVGVVSIRAFKFGSPREYNFSDDWLELEFEVEDDFLDRAEKLIFLPKYRDLCTDRMGKTWCSRDGFTSDMPEPCRRPNGVHRYEAGRRYECPHFDGLREVFAALRDETCDDELHYFGGIVELLWVIRSAAGESWTDVTDRLLENIRGNHSLSEFCTTLEPDEVAELYPAATTMLEAAEAAKKAVETQLGPYLERVVAEDVKARARRQADEQLVWLGNFIGDVREAVEKHPEADKVNAALKELRQTWREHWDSDPDGERRVQDAPGQMLLEGFP